MTYAAQYADQLNLLVLPQVLLQTDGQLVWHPNNTLRTKPLVNLSRSNPRWEAYTCLVDIDTPDEVSSHSQCIWLQCLQPFSCYYRPASCSRGLCVRQTSHGCMTPTWTIVEPVSLPAQHNAMCPVIVLQVLTVLAQALAEHVATQPTHFSCNPRVTWRGMEDPLKLRLAVGVTYSFTGMLTVHCLVGSKHMVCLHLISCLFPGRSHLGLPVLTEFNFNKNLSPVAAMLIMSLLTWACCACLCAGEDPARYVLARHGVLSVVRRELHKAGVQYTVPLQQQTLMRLQQPSPAAV